MLLGEDEDWGGGGGGGGGGGSGDDDGLKRWLVGCDWGVWWWGDDDMCWWSWKDKFVVMVII